MGPKKGRNRFQRRDAEELERLMKRREELARQAPGGSPERPLELASASQVEPRAKSTPCPRCEAELLLVTHEATRPAGIPLRELTMRCKQCGRVTKLWFRLQDALPN